MSLYDPNDDLYSLLGLIGDGPFDAKQVDDAFRRRMREVHPDLNPDDPRACGKAANLIRARDQLQDPAFRGPYDADRAAHHAAVLSRRHDRDSVQAERPTSLARTARSGNRPARMTRLTRNLLTATAVLGIATVIVGGAAAVTYFVTPRP